MKPRHAVALTALLVACGVGGDGGTALGAGDVQSSLLARDDGVLGGLFMVDGTEPRHGKPRQRFDEAQQGVTAVIRVGPLKGQGTLTVDWYQVNAWGGREHLFQHQIRARANTFAWSVGVAKTHLAAGDYQVTASLGRDRLTTAWTVRRGRRSSAPTNTGQAPATGQNGATAVSDWYKELERQAEAADAARHRPPACSGSPDISASETGYSPEVDASAWDHPCDADLALLAAMGGAERQVAAGVGEARTTIDPCTLPGGSDMPGAVLSFTAKRAGAQPAQAKRTITLPDDAARGLQAVGASDPPPGTKVRAGQRIQITAGAVDFTDFFTGIMSIQITTEPGGSLGEFHFPPPPRPCDNTRRMRAGNATYQVPADPPPVIHVMVVAEDYVGNQAVANAFYPTRPGVWIAKIVMFLEQEVESGLQLAEAAMQMVLTEDSTHHLTGTLTGTQRQTLLLDKCPSETTIPGSFEASVTGTHDGDILHLTVGGVQGRPPQVTPCPGAGLPGRMAPLARLQPFQGALASVAKSPDGTFESEGEARVPSGPSSFTISWMIRFQHSD